MDIAQPIHRKGWPLIEATMPLRLRIIAEDIACAVAGDPQHCVIAQALHRMFGPDSFVEVYRSVTYAFLGDHYERFINPAATVRAVEHYDRTGEWLASDLLFTPPARGKTLAHRREWERQRAGKPRQVRDKNPRVFIRGSVGYLDSMTTA